MVSKIRQFESITFDSIITDDRIICWTENSVFSLTFAGEQKTITGLIGPFDVRAAADIIVIRNREVIQVQYKGEIKHIDAAGYKLMQLKYIDENRLIYRYSKDGSVWGILCFDFSGTVIWQNKFNVPFLLIKGQDNTGILYGFSKVLYSMDLNTGLIHSICNTIDFYPEISSDIASIAIYGKLLFVFCRTEYNAFTICLDAESGKIVKELKDIKSNLAAFQDNLYFSKGFYKMGRLNPRTFEIEYYDFEKTLAPENITVSSHLFYITAQMKMIFVDGLVIPKNKLCIIDMRTGILEHVENFGPEVVIGVLRVVDDKIFVHTSDHVLHQFEYVV